MAKQVTAVQWISTLIAIIVAVLTMAAYAHTTFITVREKKDITSRLDRIEKKVDMVLQKQSVR